MQSMESFMRDLGFTEDQLRNISKAEIRIQPGYVPVIITEQFLEIGQMITVSKRLRIVDNDAKSQTEKENPSFDAGEANSVHGSTEARAFYCGNGGCEITKPHWHTYAGINYDS